MREEEEENLDKVLNRHVGSAHISTRITRPALWCLLTRLGEKFEVFTGIINQEGAWFFPGLHVTLWWSVTPGCVTTEANYESVRRNIVSMPGVKQQEIKIIRSIHAFFFLFCSWKTNVSLLILYFLTSTWNFTASYRKWEGQRKKERAGCTVWHFWLCTWAQHSPIYWNPTLWSCYKASDSNFSFI